MPARGRVTAPLAALAALGAWLDVGVAAAAPTIQPNQTVGCGVPNEKLCLSEGYLDTACGVKNREVCRPFVETRLNEKHASSTAPTQRMLRPNQDQMPKDLKEGKFYGYPGPQQQQRFTVRGNHPMARTVMTQYRAPQPVDPAVAAKKHRKPEWDENGQKILSCAEFAYEDYYDWARFTDAAVACGSDYNCLLTVAFMPTTPGIARRTLKRKDGKPLTTQFAVKGVYSMPKNDMFGYDNFIYAGNGHGLPETAELNAARDAVTAGKTWYKFGCPANSACPTASFKTEWDFHQALYNSNKDLTLAEFEEYERRKAQFRRLVALHTAAAAVEAQALNKNPFRIPIEPVLPFDMVTHDPFERIDFMRTADAVRIQNANVNLDKLPIPLDQMPGAGIISIPVKAYKGPSGVLPLPGKPKPGVLTKQQGMVNTDPCALATFDRGISEMFNYGPLSCKLGEFMREEYARKAAGQKSCLDLDNDDCDWSPSMFRARFMEGVPYLEDQARAELECVDWTGDVFSKPNGKPNLVAAEAYIAEMKAQIAEAMKKLAPYRQGAGAAGKKFGRTVGDDEVYGDKKWFAGGYDYSLGWSVEPLQKTGTGQVCDLKGSASGKVGIDGWMGGHQFEIVDGLVQGAVNEDGKKKTHTLAHLRILKKDLFDPIDETWSQAFDKKLAEERTQLPPVKPSFTVMAGPVPLTGALWAELTYGVKLKMYGELKSQTCSASDITFGLHTTFTPYVGLDGRAQVGVGISGLLSAGIRGTINILTIGLPLELDLVAKFKTIADELQAVLSFDAQLSMTLATLAGRISLYIEILFWEEEWELFQWKGIGPATISLMEPLHAELPLVGMN